MTSFQCKLCLQRMTTFQYLSIGKHVAYCHKICHIDNIKLIYIVHVALELIIFMQWDCFDCKCARHTSPEIIISKAVEIALLKGSLIRVAVANRPIISGYWVDATIGKGLPMEIDNVAKAKSSTAHKQVTDVATETE